MTSEELEAAERKKAAEKAKADEVAAQLQRERDAELAKIPVQIVGGPGLFNISGPGLGKPGILTIGGREVRTTRWDDRTIRGEIPEEFKGEVILTNAAGLVRKGVYPYVPPVKHSEPVAKGDHK